LIPDSPPRRAHESYFDPGVFLVVLALTFDFLNGFHDAANSVATVVATRVLSPTGAVFWAAFFNFVAASPARLEDCIITSFPDQFMGWSRGRLRSQAIHDLSEVRQQA
jgi:hypothetical protein